MVGEFSERSSLWIEAQDMEPLLSAAARNEAERQAVREELRLGQEDSGGLVRLADYFRLTRAHAAVSLEESLGLAARPLVSGTTDFVMAQASQGETLLDAMRIMAAAYNKLHGGEYNSVARDATRCAFRVDDAAFPYTQVAGAATILMLDCVIISLHGAFCTLTGRDLTPMLLRVQSRRSAPARCDPLGFWSCAVERGARWYSIEYAPEAASLPLSGARCSEAAIYNRILGLIEKREAALSERPIFAALVRQTLRDGARSQEEAAARIGVSAATLRRKLLDEGASFRALRREHLNEAAKLGLMHAERIADLADALGFSDPRSFARAFKGWNGRSPQAFRNAAKSGR